MIARDVWAKLRDAYDANRGVRLTAEDVTQLVLMDNAIQSVTHPDGEDGAGLPQSPKKPKS